MLDFNVSDGSKASDSSSESGASKDRRPLVALVIGAVALAVVLLLMSLAVRRAPSTRAGNRNPQRAEDTAGRDYAPYIVIETYLSELRTNVIGSRELEVTGFVRNTGSLVVDSADLRCLFQTNSGEETYRDIPLVCDTALEEMDIGPLMPKEGRDFGVRIGEFPPNLDPESLRVDVANVQVRKP